MVTDSGVLPVLETYYDTAPRAAATAHEVGPFTLFVRTDAAGWPYYGRPRLGAGHAFTPEDVRLLLAAQDEFGAPHTIEWVHETTPTLLAAARDAGLEVEECPLLVLDTPRLSEPPDGVAIEVMAADSRHLAETRAAVDAAFRGSDETAVTDGVRIAAAIDAGLSRVVGAFEVHDDGLGTAIGAGTHNPRGATTELVGIGVLPRAQHRGIGAAITSALVADALRLGLSTIFLSAQDDAVARIYGRIGFRRVGTACVVG